MANTGRNEACPCGSGKKYKRCCLPREEANASARIAAQVAALQHFGSEDDGLDAASNRVVDLIHAGRLDEAEAAAHALLRDYPDVIDGLDRLATVYEARGDRVNAAAYYHKAADYIRANADYFEPAAEADMRARADKLTSPH